MRFLIGCSSVSILLLLVLGIRAQQVYYPEGKKHYSDKCEIALVDLITTKVRVIGSFKFLRNESEFETASFHLPGTTFYVVARAGVDDETLQSHTEHYSVTIDLMISARRKYDIRHSQKWARGEMLANSEMGRLALSTRINRKTVAVDMVCTSLNLRDPQ